MSENRARVLSKAYQADIWQDFEPAGRAPKADAPQRRSRSRYGASTRYTEMKRPGAASNRSIGTPSAPGTIAASAGPPHGAPIAVSNNASQMTTRLAAALREHRHLRSARVLCDDDGSPLKQDSVGDHVRRAARRANVGISGAHRLRHTFCSHLAMRGAPARAIQELAGHQDLITTQRYMHLSPAAIEGAIRLLEQPDPQSAWRHVGDDQAATR